MGRTGRPVSVMLIDIDHFKDFNDRFGHAAGDAVLRRIARTIMVTVRANDLVFRFGGEEFVVICEGLDCEAALTLGERIRREIATSIEGGGSGVTASIGIASASTDCADYDALFQAADRRLYQAKAAGRNCVIGDGTALPENVPGSPARVARSG
ncbi:GGDEF domain-containing protein [Pseudorhodoplanes sp.]|uniref:GGDEF domain-containing protein n=1 Tax=Pseudorhodoplanes sp. TaxID=1934341 RepID=UPI002BB91E27|nr:GGDEF domain-containing protein [Pseudorhodoplanes sp.]HWV41713.1 GGDEF domain-containing protein [Pseudorhodoplanes sp.]